MFYRVLGIVTFFICIFYKMDFTVNLGILLILYGVAGELEDINSKLKEQNDRQRNNS